MYRHFRESFFTLALLIFVLPATAQPPAPLHQVTPWTPGPYGPGPQSQVTSIPLNSSSWTAIGPAPLGSSPAFANSGRIAGVAAHPTDPNTIYISAAGGGVWKTTNGGTSWSMLTDAQPTLYMGAIAIAPSNANVLYAGTGEANNGVTTYFGRGILASTDGGASWTLRTGPGGVFNSRRLTVSKIDIHPTDPNTAYAAVADYGANGLCCSDTGIYKTTDGGVNWTNVTGSFGLDMNRPWSDLLIDGTIPTTVYAAHGNYAPDPNNGVY